MHAPLRLIVALILLPLPLAAETACLPSKGKALRTTDDITLDYLMCQHRKQVEALGGAGPIPAEPKDELRIDDGAVQQVEEKVTPFIANTARTQRSLDSMSDLNARTGDRFKALTPRRLP